MTQAESTPLLDGVSFLYFLHREHFGLSEGIILDSSCIAVLCFYFFFLIFSFFQNGISVRSPTNRLFIMAKRKNQNHPCLASPMNSLS